MGIKNENNLDPLLKNTFIKKTINTGMIFHSGFGRYIFILLAVITASNFNAIAQQSPEKFKIAVFAPLYLDSAFDYNDEYRYSKNTFPKFLNPGLEFYEGVQLALDSLNTEKIPLEVHVFDTKNANESITQQLNRPELANVQLIIAHLANSEVKLFADHGLKKNIPVVNVNQPNDGGAVGNPFFVVLNPTLKTQCEGIYRYVQKTFSLNPIVIFRKRGQLEDRIKMYFEDFGKTTSSVPLHLKYVDLPDSFNVSHLRAHLDTLEETVCIAGSLDENFGKKLVQHLATLKKQRYQAIAFGMPTWDNISFNKNEYKGIDIIYSTPFYHSKVDKVSQSISSYFNRVMFARPSDMVYRGYEVMMRFSRLLTRYGSDLSSNLTAKIPRLFTDFDIQPVISRPSMSLEYFENKKLYFLKYQDGALKGVY